VVATGFQAPGIRPSQRTGEAPVAESPFARTAPPDDLLEPPSFLR
jgi:hypothetical protein